MNSKFYITRKNVLKGLLVTMLISIAPLLIAQSPRTAIMAKMFNPDTSSWQYKMENSEDKWSRAIKKRDFQLFTRFDLNRKVQKNTLSASIGYYGNANLFWLNNIKEIELAAAGITEQNAREFIYHVVVDDSIEIVPWSKPSVFRQNRNTRYAYLGLFNAQNKIIKLEMYNIKNFKDKSICIFNSLYMPPPIVKTVVLKYNNKYLFRPYMQHYIPSNKQHFFQQDKDHKDKIEFNLAGTINHLGITMANTLQNDMYNVYLASTIDKKTDTVYISNSWEMSYYSPNPNLRINGSYFNKAGRYQIIVVPEAPQEFNKNSMSKAVIIPFTVLPAVNRLFTRSQVLQYTGLVLFAAVLIFLLYYFFNKRRSLKEVQQKEIVTLQLQSVRSQLNPHFMFNALTGIQSLMNKGDINATNRYLTKFSRLTRNVLDDNNKDMVTINEEVNLLDDYLQMEQLRFGFKYNIHVDEKIDRINTEIPSMLLQPYIENAVKHAVSTLKETGVIAIAMLQQSKSLVLKVRDNGNGYDVHQKLPGKGTALSEKRIELLNRLNSNNAISISKKSDLSGTEISIELTNWI